LLRPDLVDAQLVDHEARLSTSLVGQRRPARESRLLLVQLEPVLPRARTEDRTAAAPNRRLGVTRASVAGALLPVKLPRATPNPAPLLPPDGALPALRRRGPHVQPHHALGRPS